MKTLQLLPLVLLVQCTTQTVDPNRPLTSEDAGKILSERYYEVDGVRKRERHIIVATSPQLETRIQTDYLW